VSLEELKDKAGINKRKLEEKLEDKRKKLKRQEEQVLAIIAMEHAGRGFKWLVY
jgi:hypothetical protein